MARESHWRTTPPRYAGRVEMVPREASMRLPIKVALGRGSSSDLGLMRKPADWSEETARSTAEVRAWGDDEMKAASSRYCMESVWGNGSGGQGAR